MHVYAKTESKKTVLVISPAPVYPTSAGNRRRVLAVCEALMSRGFDIDFAYYAHEDQVYRMYGTHPPTDVHKMVNRFRNFFLIEPDHDIRVKTKANYFFLDDWYSPQLDLFVSWYFSNFPETYAAVVNYVFLSAAFLKMPEDVVKVIDTHDRFTDRQFMYNLYRGEPNFFYVDKKSEIEGLSRAEMVLAIQDNEAQFFTQNIDKPVYVMPHRSKQESPPTLHLDRVGSIGFLGHGNDPNVVSISKFAHSWAQRAEAVGEIRLKVAGEVCTAFKGSQLRGVEWMGYIDNLADFYASVDLVIAPLLLGTGLKIKIIEALAFGKPVVGTKLAFEGLDPTHPGHTCETSDDVIAFVLAMRSDPVALDDLCSASRNLFESYMDKAQRQEDSFLSEFCARYDAAGSMSKRPTLLFTNKPRNASTEIEPEILVARLDHGVAWRETSLASVTECPRRIVSIEAESGQWDLSGRLLATEKRVAHEGMSNDQLARAFDPLRDRWVRGEIHERPSSDISDVPQPNVPCRVVPGIEALWTSSSLHVSPALAEITSSSEMQAEEWDRLCACLINCHPAWITTGELRERTRSSLELVALAPTRLLQRPSHVWGVLVNREQGGDHNYIRFTMEKAWAVEGVGTSFCSHDGAMRQDLGLTIVPVQMRIRLDRPFSAGGFDLAICAGRYTGVIRASLN